jgi:pSer/pThr/pTyr-binding forkhead associated (FHA) protein
MSQDKPKGSTTMVDFLKAPIRLKESLVPPGTGIYLRVEEGPELSPERPVFDLSSGGVYLIGRQEADIVLDDEAVSRKHAEIGLYGPGAYTLRDLVSTNGTRLNGRRVEEKARLVDGDVIEIGEYRLRFSVVEEADSRS